uniref:Protein broad-minded n=1 Tax=Scophthalmus maximus TaxID=52904 RepID=A0A8D2ZSL4_SCOMX
MSRLSAEDESELQLLLKQLLISINDRISGAPSTECAEEILLHLEETDKNFHNYEFVKYFRQYVETSLGTVVEEETKNLTRGEGQHAIGSGHDTLIHAVTRRTRDSAEYQQMMQTLKNTMIVAVESLINRFEEDQMRKEELHRERQQSQSNSQYIDNCSDSDSSFNQSYAFIRQEQLQDLAEKLDPSRPKEVRWQALQALCCAPPSDVLSCESWSGLRRKLCAALTEPDPDLADNVLQFFAKSFSSSPLNVTREIYTSLGRLLLLPLPQIRLMNDFQKEVTTFWIRHPEKYMEEIIESTFSLLSLHHEPGSTSPRTEKTLEPIHLLALLDIRATWFNKWMHGCYSRTVVLRLLERKYKSLQFKLLHRSFSALVQRSVYSGKELEYAVVVHSLCFLGKLLIYTNGRKLFPVKVRKRKDPVGLADLVVILIHIMYQQPERLHSDTSYTDPLSPSGLVMEVLWTLGDRTECAAECLHQPAVIETLLAPVICELKSPAVALTLVADILARVANTDRGLALFLHEENVLVAHGERTTAALVVVQFTLRLLNDELPSLSESDARQTLCGAFIFVCRQMYNTCEGLQVLRPHGLHAAIAAAWKKTSSLSERVPTPMPGPTARASTQELQNMLIWEETLLDSLLNFAATPKGLLLLQQTGAMNECVSYMFSRFSKKLQVSRCEKFGYGVMVTQVAATAPGVVALRCSGFVQALVTELWSTLECGSEEVRGVRPQPTPMDPIDRSCLKVPRVVLELIDRLIAVNSDAKIHSLFHYEQSHTFGLRLLSVLCSNLDSFLLLESQYDICSALLQSQRENVTEEFIVDSLSVERNHVLVRVGVVGGPSERRLPPRALQEGEDPYPWPMFSSHPLPPCYTLDLPNILHISQDSEITSFLSASVDAASEEGWMLICRRHYCDAMTSEPGILTGHGEILVHRVAVDSLRSSRCHFPSHHTHLNHGVRTRPPKAPLNDQRWSDHLDAARALKTSQSNYSRFHLKIECCSPQVCDCYPGHDWLASTVFLIMAGDADRSLRLLLGLSSLLTSAFIWPAGIHASVHVAVETAESGIPPVYWCTAHYVEMLLKAEVPLVHAAFRMSGFTPSQTCLHWLTQCFWNYLDWTEICHYVSTCVVMGPDYQVYMCTAVFKHLQPEILRRTQSQELQVFLKEEPIRGFEVSDYLEFMERLERSYRDVVLTDMKTLRDPVG